MKNNITIFKSVTDVSTGFNRDVYFALSRIKEGKSKELVEQIRTFPKEKSDLLKRSLPGVCFNGTFRYRSASGLISHSGLMVIDLDKFSSTEEAILCKEKLKEDSYIFSCWISPSGLGVKALIKIPPDADNHKGYFSSFDSYLNHPNWDDSGSDVSRFCFESYDPEIYINNESDTWMVLEEPELEDIGVSSAIIPVTSENRIIENLMTWWQKKYGHTKGSRNSNLFKLAVAFNDFGINKSEAERVLSNFKEVDFNQKEILNVVKSAYKKVENHGSKEFEDKEAQQKVEKLIRSGKKSVDIIKSLPELKDVELDSYIESVKETLDIDEFWYYDENNKIKLSIHKFKFWLEQNNFFKFYPSDTSNTFTFIKKDQNLLDETNDKRIKDYVLNYIINKPNIGYSPYDFMAGSGSYFHPNFLSMIDTTEVKLKEDTKDVCYLYYRNCVLEITSNKVNQIDYIDIDGCVWKKQIIDRDFKKFDHHDAVFRKFIWLISGKSIEKYNSFKSVIGYLMHSFKTSANNKAVVFNDETISENPNGGSGKGLFWNALKYMKKVSIIDGKTFEFTKSFPYQTVSTDTQILVFDDVKKNFNFESLFSLITEGITLEYKGQDAIQIPVEKSPKILITTNYTLGGVGGSHERRKFEIEMSGHFSYKHTPLDEFGHMLFSDWNEEEWLRFDNYMVNCEQYYLNNGLVSHEFHNLESRKFIKETSFEFYEWVNDGNIRLNERIDKSMCYDTFVNEYSDLKKWLTQRTFTKWLNLFGKYKGYDTTEGKSNSLRWILFSTEENTNDIPEDFPF